jgi:hypothetical protein
MNAPTIPVTDKLNTGDGARRVCAMARDILGGNGILLDHRVLRPAEYIPA